MHCFWTCHMVIYDFLHGYKRKHRCSRIISLPQEKYTAEYTFPAAQLQSANMSQSAYLSNFRNRSRSGAKFAYSGSKAPPIALASEPMVPANTTGRTMPSQL